MARHRSGTIRIDVSDVIEEIEDDDLLDEVSRRKLLTSMDGLDSELVREAWDELRAGRHTAALCILDRLLSPKWPNERAAQAAYQAACDASAIRSEKLTK